jgi:hypothetical protein
MPATEDARIVVDLYALHQLIPASTRRGYQVIGPTLCDGQDPAGASGALVRQGPGCERRHVAIHP